MPAWLQQLTKSLHKTRSQPESRYFQLATVDSHGAPKCRTVVFRGLVDETALSIISDTRSQKWPELEKASRAEICWYFTKTREQYRFTTHCRRFSASQGGEFVQQYWCKLSDAGKKQFFWGEPGETRDPSYPLKSHGDFSVPPPHFGVMLFDVDKVDYLNLRGNPQQREIHTRDDHGSWETHAIIP
ncbi:pyridoxamine 5'-phosphate oxidase family protein [Alteromonas halophila]|uniref:Pyridoxamine 5'-phosphate oxidase Alr4036 family FMN-binding domain-containing protein n=1 Tax=Alteromonas halophila TaxID=516698 RepID=A0A918MUZ9_9ALTE|nr:pyridoxamine 5'-phosphate oxidase family protein [Alteromonas halophila]GGW76882.1 hypothetical protein GCM10007391_07180 [Alteromonas halophila]